jgi:voltage-gated potassium channel
MAEQVAVQKPEEQSDPNELKSTGYELFILLLSLVSVFNMAVQFLGNFFGVKETTIQVITIINIFLTLFFLFDFSYRILTAASKSGYFWGRQGWADLLACTPQLRIFRLFRIVRAVRLMRRFGVKNMVNEVVNNRASSALYITVFLILLVAEIAAITVLKAEASNPDANLVNASDAVWWVFVTLTTVGYGDFYPTTNTGRIIGIFVMFSGVALIGILASFLASFMLGTAAKPKEEELAPDDPKAKVRELRKLLEEQGQAQADLQTKIDELDSLL